MFTIDLPFDVLILIIERLDVKNLFTLSMVSRRARDTFNDPDIWSLIAQRTLRYTFPAPRSLLREKSSTPRLKRLVKRAIRIEDMLHEASARYHIDRTTSPIRLHIAHPNATFELSLSLDPDEQLVVTGMMLSGLSKECVKVTMLPGGRWVLGFAWTTSGRYKLFCWDLDPLRPSSSTPVSESVEEHSAPQSLNAVAVYQSEVLVDLSFSQSFSLAPQLDESGQAVNLSLTYAYAGEGAEVDRHAIAVIQLVWDTRGVPRFERKAVYERTNAQSSWYANWAKLEGSFVLHQSRHREAIVLWNWRAHTHTLIPIHDKEDPFHELGIHSANFIPPFFLADRLPSDVSKPDGNQSCHVFAVDVEQMTPVKGTGMHDRPPVQYLEQFLIPIHAPNDVKLDSEVLDVMEWAGWTPRSSSRHRLLIKGALKTDSDGLRSAFGGPDALLRLEHSGQRITALRVLASDYPQARPARGGLYLKHHPTLHHLPISGGLLAIHGWLSGKGYLDAGLTRWPTDANEEDSRPYCGMIALRISSKLPNHVVWGGLTAFSSICLASGRVLLFERGEDFKEGETSSRKSVRCSLFRFPS